MKRGMIALLKHRGSEEYCLAEYYTSDTILLFGESRPQPAEYYYVEAYWEDLKDFMQMIEGIKHIGY